MKSARSPFLPTWTLATALLGLLAVLASLQYHWLSEVSEAQRERTRSRLERDARLFAKDFDRELTRIFRYSQVIRESAGDPEGHRPAAPEAKDLRAFYELWTDVAPFPDFVRDALCVERHASGQLRFARFDPEAGELEEVAGEPELEGLGKHLGQLSWGGPPGPDLPRELLDPETPAVIVPFGSGRHRGRLLPEQWRGPPERSRGFRERFRSSFSPPQVFVVFRLAPERALAPLAERHFGDVGGLEFFVRVVERQDPRRVIFEAGPSGSSEPPSHTGDAASDLFGFLSLEEARQLMAELPVDPGSHREGFYADMFFNALSQIERRWRLVVTHPSGSLDAAVAAAHQRNLVLGVGILLVLATAVVMLIRATRRTQVLARQQLEFVAGVTHELRTPLAAMRSAGENLADGVVRDPSQVSRYGTLIAREGRRLSDMVEQVLEYAGIQSGRRAYRRETVRTAEIVRGALAESRPLFEDKELEVRTEIADDVPEVTADPSALRRALVNLIGNAVKYGEGGGWIAVRARGDGKEVQISVEDRGRGITDGDLPHVFEPFYRGKDLAAGRIPGSGLGLALVRHISEAHGGRVTVSSREGEGSTFTLHLPAAASTGQESVRTQAREAEA